MVMLERFVATVFGSLLWVGSLAGSAIAADAPSNTLPTKSTPVVASKTAKPKSIAPFISEVAPDQGVSERIDPMPDLSSPTTPAKAFTKSPAVKTLQEKSKISLGDAFISQNTLRIYLERPTQIFVYDARGQIVFHVDSHRAMETLPLYGMSAGFLYLTLRSGPLELTKKILYTGK